ncbi:Y-family DNA polymerase [Breznakia pachnodae]|uniref:DNA polymerase V n=1 Tax=Breznakia pachnodae TaxID=265178 RepID=A0ABU0E0E6_9FIRM|nr:DNA methylase [Breznakia pachnodae]MDQ0360020.1 DNA polymerase V [Breznakia pachnodae]
MAEKKKAYIAIDLKSFYASVECVERSLNPLTTNLVVADDSRTEKTICLAVSPSLKSFGIPGRPRLFEVTQKVKEINNKRRIKAPNRRFIDKTYDYDILKKSLDYEVDFIVAKPQMAHYIDISTKIYEVYLKYIAPEDIHVYSIDEVFIDATPYLDTYKKTAHELALAIIQDVYQTTGITATAGIGTNLYLSKVAMDIVAKHIKPDIDGVRIAELDEMSYRKLLWNHQPLIDFWRVGRGYSKKLEENGLYTMGDIARCSLHDEDLLYKLFGINAELLIDHAWGWEPCSITDIKAYKPDNHTLGTGQVLHSPYSYDKAKLIVREMADALALDLFEKKLVTNKLVLSVGYDADNLLKPEIRDKYRGPITTDHYGKKVPKRAHGTINLKKLSSSSILITNAMIELYDSIIDKNLFIRRIYISVLTVEEGTSLHKPDSSEQLDLFTDYDKINQQQQEEDKILKKEKQEQEALLKIKKKFGKNAVLKATSLLEGATAKERNDQIGGHKK